MTDPIATLYACDKLIEKQRFVGLDQNPKGVRDLLYCAIRGAETEIERLRADNARLREALAPFAAVVLPASHWQSGWPDYAPLDTAMGSGRASLTIGDCRRARKAMEANNGK